MQAVTTVLKKLQVCAYVCVHHQQIVAGKQRLVDALGQAQELCIAIPLARKHVYLQQDVLHASPTTA